MESRRNGPQLSSRHDDDDDDSVELYRSHIALVAKPAPDKSMRVIDKTRQRLIAGGQKQVYGLRYTPRCMGAVFAHNYPTHRTVAQNWVN